MVRITKRGNPYLVALSWDQGQLNALVASANRDELKLIDAITIDLDGTESAREMGAKLAEQFQKNKVSSYKLLVGVPRSQVELCEMTLPPAAPTELPEMVRNEVMRQVSDLPEDALIDYMTTTAEESVMRVEAAVLRPETNDFIQELAKGLDNKPSQIVLRPLAVASLFDRLTGEDHSKSLLLNWVDPDVDLSILENGQVQFSRTVRLSNSSQSNDRVEKLFDEVRRTLAVAPVDASDESDVQHVYLFGDANRMQRISERLAEQLKLPVSLLDPLVGIQLSRNVDLIEVYRYTALIGILRDFAESSPPIDFVNPNRPPEPTRYGRKVALYGTVAAVALWLIVWQLGSELSLAQSEYDEVANELERQTQLLEKISSRSGTVDAIERWQNEEINWLAELQELSERFPDPGKAVVQRMSMSDSNNGIGVISMSVRRNDAAQIASLESELRDEFHDVVSRRISQAAEGSQFPFQFEAMVTVKPRPPESADGNSPSGNE